MVMTTTGAVFEDDMADSIEIPMGLPMAEVAHRYLQATYVHLNGHVIRTAATLGVTQATVYKWLRRGVPSDCRLRGGLPLPPDLKHHQAPDDTVTP